MGRPDCSLNKIIVPNHTSVIWGVFYIQKERREYMKNYKQADSRWGSNSYAGDSMAGSGCGPTSVANIVESDPWAVAQWMTSHGYASNGSGTYWGGIPAALTAYGHNGQQLNYSSLYGYRGSSIENSWKHSISSGNYVGILLMGPGIFTSGGHFITITQYSNGRYYVHDPASYTRDGWHNWSDFSGAVKVFYLARTKQSSPTPSPSKTWTAINTAISTADSVNVRSTPNDSINTNILRKVNAGDRFEVDGSIIDGWVHVKVANLIGYIYQTYVKYDGTSTPPQPTKPEPSHTTSYYYKFNVTQIKPGDTGIKVLLLQEILKSRGIYTGGLDRSYGTATEASVRKYQSLRNLTVDGICGPATWADLIALPTD